MIYLLFSEHPDNIRCWDSYLFTKGKSMKMRRRAWSALAVLCLLATGLLTTPNAAQASSGYDSLISVTSDLYVYTDGSAKTQKMNLKDIWWDEYKEALQKRQNIDPTYGPPGFISGFESIMESGSWAVYMETSTSGNTIHMFGTTDPNGYCNFYTEPTDSKKYLLCYLHAGYDWYEAHYLTHGSYGGNGCWQGTCTDNTLAIYSEPWIVSASTGGSAWMISESSSAYTEIYAMNFDVNYPVGYAGAIVPTEPDLQEYVAMGDSFSSGEGIEPFLAGTDIADNPGTSSLDEENRCHRSNRAYPKVLQRDVDLSYSLEFVACSGATTSNITTSGQWGEPAQINALSSSTDVVTLSVGGNDIGFQTFATACVVGSCDEDSPFYDASVAAINSLGDDLEETYEQVLSTIANDGQLYVMNYPMMVPMDMEWDDPATLICPYMMGGTNVDSSYSLHPNRWGNARAAQDVIARLNAKIEQAVYNVSVVDPRIHYVDVSTAFEGHDICSASSQFFNTNLPPATFHPKEVAHQTMATVMSEAIS